MGVEANAGTDRPHFFTLLLSLSGNYYYPRLLCQAFVPAQLNNY